jgi:hypothetical protein
MENKGRRVKRFTRYKFNGGGVPLKGKGLTRQPGKGAKARHWAMGSAWRLIQAKTCAEGLKGNGAKAKGERGRVCLVAPGLTSRARQ